MALPFRCWRLWLVVLTVLAVPLARAEAETFEFLTYTPPAGWTSQTDAGTRTHVRKDAAGAAVLMLFASRAATGSPADVFAEEWQARVQPTFAGPLPRPQLQKEGDFTAAVGAGQGTYEGQAVTIVGVTFVGRGRALTIVGLATSRELLGQIAASLEGVQVAPAAAAGRSAAQDPGAGAAATGAIELDVDAPPGYVARREGAALVIAPVTPSRELSCTYAVWPSRPSRGSLEADAQAAVTEVLPGWRKRHSDETRNMVMRGTSAAGWPYHWYQLDVERQAAPQVEYAIAMVMIVPAGKGRVSVVSGMGNLATCRMNDLTFARLFHSLRPRGWTSDGGKALARDLVGSWISSTSSGRSIRAFTANGGYEGALGVTTSTAVTPDTALERTTTSVKGGSYVLRGNELTIRAEGGAKPTTYRIRIAEEYEMGKWNRALYLLHEGADAGPTPYEVQYYLQRK